MTAAVEADGRGFPCRVRFVRVPQIAADAGRALAGKNLVAIGLVAARLHEPVHDHQPVADLAEAGRLVEKRLLLDAGHPLLGVLLGNDGFELVGLDLDAELVLGHTHPLGIFRRRLRQSRRDVDGRDDQDQDASKDCFSEPVRQSRFGSWYDGFHGGPWSSNRVSVIPTATTLWRDIEPMKTDRREFFKLAGAAGAGMIALGDTPRDTARRRLCRAIKRPAETMRQTRLSSTELFLDNEMIEVTPGVSRRLHPPKKHLLNPVVRCDRWCDGNNIQPYTTMYDPEDKLFKMWARTGSDWKSAYLDGNAAYMLYFTSTDGVHWDKPDLGVMEIARPARPQHRLHQRHGPAVADGDACRTGEVRRAHASRWRRRGRRRSSGG